MNHWKHLCRLSLWLSNPVIELYKENVWSSQCQEIRVENLKNDLITATIGEDTEFTHNYHPQEFPKIVFPWFSGKNPRDGGAQWLFFGQEFTALFVPCQISAGKIGSGSFGSGLLVTSQWFECFACGLFFYHQKARSDIPAKNVSNFFSCFQAGLMWWHQHFRWLPLLSWWNPNCSSFKSNVFMVKPHFLHFLLPLQGRGTRNFRLHGSYGRAVAWKVVNR